MAKAGRELQIWRGFANLKGGCFGRCTGKQEWVG